MSRQSKSYQEVKNKLLKDPEFKAEYEKNKPFSDIALKIVRIRSEAGLTQAELAKKLGVSQPVISKIESLNIEDIQLSTIFKIAKALNLEVKIDFIDKDQQIA